MDKWSMYSEANYSALWDTEVGELLVSFLNFLPPVYVLLTPELKLRPCTSSVGRAAPSVAASRPSALPRACSASGAWRMSSWAADPGACTSYLCRISCLSSLSGWWLWEHWKWIRQQLGPWRARKPCHLSLWHCAAGTASPQLFQQFKQLLVLATKVSRFHLGPVCIIHCSAAGKRLTERALSLTSKF